METNNRKTYAMFAIVVVSCAFGSFTQTVTNSMLSGIQADFGVSDYTSQWLTTIFMLCIGITVPLVTHLSKKTSIRQLIVISLSLFLLGALIDWVAPNFLVLFAGRIPQAVATGITLPIIQAIAMTRFPKDRTGTAMGIAGIAMGFAPNIGPLIGGALVGTLGWRSFFIMLAIALVILLILAVFMIGKEDVPDDQSRLDILSFVLSTFGFGGLLLSFTNAATMHVSDPIVFMPGIIGIACLILFVLRQERIENPLIDMGIFHSPNYRISFIAQNLLFASFMAITLLLPLFVQNICGRSALDAGMVFVPATILAAILNPLAGILCDRFGARPICIAGSIALFAGAASMVFVDATAPLWLITLIQTVRGAGVSVLIGPLNSWGMRQLKPHNMIDGSAFFITVRQACASLGTALMMLIVAIGAGTATAFSAAFALSAAFAACVLVCAIVKIR